MKVEAAVLGSPSPISVRVYVDVQHHERKKQDCGTELRSCVKVEVSVLDSSSITVLMASVDVKRR